MKNFIMLVAISFISSSVFAGECLNGTCRQPVKRVASSVTNVTRTIVSAPVKATRNVASNIHNRRVSRRSR